VLQRNSYSIETQLSRRWDWGEEGRVGNDPDDPFENFLDGCCACDAKGLKEKRREHKALSTMRDLVTYLSSIREARTSLIVFSGGWKQYTASPQSMARQTPTITTGNGRLGINPPDTLGTNRRACVEAQNQIVMYDNARSFRDLIDQAVRSNVVFYTLDPGGLRAPEMANGLAEMERLWAIQKRRLDSLMTLAYNTDGLPIVNTNDLMGGADRIINDVSAYYLLGYYSTNLKRDGRLRRIKVKVKRDDIEVVARRSYVAENAAAIARAEAEARSTAGPSVPDAVTEAVKTALGPLARLEANAGEMFVSAVRGRSEIVVVAEVSAAEMSTPGGAWNRGVTVDATATNAAGEKLGTASGTVEPAKRSVLLRIPLEVANGSARVTVTSRGQASTAANQVDVAGGPGDLVGAPIAFRGTPSAQSALSPVADLLFRRTERAHVEWPVSRALDRREARLLDRRGQPLPIAVNLTEREATAGPSVVADLVLSPLAPGDYVIELTAAAGSETVKRYLGLRIAR
jgi:VWFA-related protein